MAGVALVALLHPLILRMLAWPLQAESSSSAVDYYGLLGDELGVSGFKPFDAAADWQRKSPGGKILLLAPRRHRIVEIGAVPPFEETCQSELTKRGVPPGDVWPTRAAADDAWGMSHAVQDWLCAHRQASLSITCSPFRSGYLQYVFRKVLQPAEIGRFRLEILPDPSCPMESWWRSRTGAKEFMYSWLYLFYAWAEGDRPHVEPAGSEEFQRQVRAAIGKAPE